jgi:hypothetical protein
VRRHTRAGELDRFLTAVLAVVAIGCADGSKPNATPPPAAVDPEIDRQLTAGLSKAINDASARNKPLEYEYDEDLLARIDQVETYLAGGAEGEAPRFMPDLTEAEELEHFRETIRLWESSTGRKLRPEIDQLKADVAARKPDGPRFHPDFHRRFGATFDPFIKFEVADMQRRRNLEVHDKAGPLLEPYRSRAPEQVRTWVETPDRQYPVPAAAETRAN